MHNIIEIKAPLSPKTRQRIKVRPTAWFFSVVSARPPLNWVLNFACPVALAIRGRAKPLMNRAPAWVFNAFAR